MGQFAAGRKAHGFCDVCGFRALLADLRENHVAGKRTGVMACRTCYDPDHPQNFTHLLRVNDPQALRNPRPDPSLEASRVIIPVPET